MRVASEPFLDTNGDGAWSANGDGQYNGVLPSAASLNTTPANTVYVRASLVQVLSSLARAMA